MEQRHKDLLLAKRLEISCVLRFRDIRRHLLDNRVLNGTDLDEIENEETQADQGKALLDILPTKGPNAFTVFRDALKDRYPHLARILQDEGRRDLPKDTGIKGGVMWRSGQSVRRSSKESRVRFRVGTQGHVRT
ncbi:hypothetical protein Bbelb_296140 [Branchiostoma belcheri]|nr:hypothetical protein Bbelb_296140 [Branchiostoma belcheri]